LIIYHYTKKKNKVIDSSKSVRFYRSLVASTIINSLDRQIDKLTASGGEAQGSQNASPSIK